MEALQDLGMRLILQVYGSKGILTSKMNQNVGYTKHF
jgi:hypothetical protein